MKSWVTLFSFHIAVCSSGLLSAAPLPEVSAMLAASPNIPEVFAVLRGRRVWVTKDGGQHFSSEHLPAFLGRCSQSPLGDDLQEPEGIGTPTTETETDEEAPSELPDLPPATLPPRAIAISNLGVWAVAVDNIIYIRNPNSGHHRLRVEGVAQILFDRDDRLWVLARQSIQIFPGPDYRRPTDQSLLDSTGRSLHPGPGPDEITVLTNNGFSTYRMTDFGLSKTTRYSDKMIDAIAPVRGGGRGSRQPEDVWYVLRDGRLFQQFRDGRRLMIPLSFPKNSSRLYVNYRGEFAVYNAANRRWQIRTKDAILTSSAQDLVIDAALRFQMTDTANLLADPLPEEPRIPTTDTFLPLPSVSETVLIRPLLYPPTCKQDSMLLPDITIRFARSVDRGQSTTPSNQTRAQWFFGIQLDWRLFRPDPIPCRKRWAKFARAEQERRERIETIRASRLQTMPGASGASAQHLIDRRIEAAKRTAVIRVIQPQ